ncbi:MAG: LamB/YcsF family protein [Candidatus Bathyarchaeota archaeon]|nr:LamB/YcsF family protein [Candidatus Bathyarchaeota archaeon]
MRTPLQIDINCDLGESFGAFRVGNDAEMMPFITSANVACGFHGGDPNVIAETVNLAKENGVAVGAHPGFPDLVGFGRRHMELSKKEVRNMVIYQLGALEAFAKASNVKLRHVKPHGALYNVAAKDKALAGAIIDAVSTVDPKLVLFAMAGSRIAKMASKAGLRVAQEAFIDRAYNPDGSLVPRTSAGAVVEDEKLAVKRAIQMVKEEAVKAIDGRLIEFRELHTLCVHGDTSNSLEIAKSVKSALLNAHIQVRPVHSFL